MSKKPIISRQKLVEGEKEDESAVFKEQEEKKIEVQAQATSISIPEFLVGEPYPYFYHTWNKLLLCDLNDTAEVFNIYNDADSTEPNIYIYNKQLDNDFETQHNKYGNSLQNYYNVVPQTGIVTSEWKEEERININNITPVLLQKCDNIMTTLLFMPLDQCHDFRGGRTVGSASWVTEIPKGVLKKDVDIDDVANGITENLNSNDFMNTLVKTSFSGKQNIVGIMVIGDDSHETLLSSESAFKLNTTTLDIQKIMDGYGQMITVASDILMSCDPKGNRQRLTCGSKVAQVIFLGFTSDGWDKGMHDVWSMNEKKHIYSIKIDSIKQMASGAPEVKYSGDKVTVIENIVPCYEMLYKSKEEGDANAFINNYQLPDGKKLMKSNFNDFFTQANFDKLYADFLAELYRTGKEIQVDEDEDVIYGGSKTTVEQSSLSEASNYKNEVVNNLTGGGNEYQESGVVRGASYKFYGVRAPDTKTSERMTPENRVRHIIFENLFIEILKKISKNISPQVHEDFNYPEETDSCLSEANGLTEGSEKINEKIKKANELYETVKDQIKVPEYSKDSYTALKEQMETGESKFIVKQFGTVNDMNIAPVIERVMDSLNCSDNCNIKNVVSEEDGDVEGVVEEESVAPVAKGKDVKTCKTDIETNIRTDLNNKYPFKFQVVSGVLDSSMQGGENMPEYFPPELDIFLTVFDAAGNLQGAVIRMTFLKVILKNTTNTKNNARVYSHFIYVGFDEIAMECEDKLGANWKQNIEQYGFALKQLLDYSVKNTYFLPNLTNSSLSNFEIALKDNLYRRWYYYFSDSAGPSVSEGINDIVKKIFNGSIGIVSDDNIDVSESIVKVAQKVYMDSPKLREIFTQQPGSNVRSYAFESIFLLRIKYIGDKSRCTDSLFLNKNKYAECMQITGDENAYFTALVNGASTIYSPPSKFALYFAPYFTEEGKFLLNVPIYKDTLLKGESPSVFKINTSSSKKKSVDTDALIPFESSYVKEKGALKTGVEVRRLANQIIQFATNVVDRSYFSAQMRAREIDNYLNIEDLSKRTKQLKDTKKEIEGYQNDYSELEDIYTDLKDKTLGPFITEITRIENPLNKPYYDKLIEQLQTVFVDNDFIIEQVTLSGNDFQRIKQDTTDFLTKAASSMKKMIEKPFDKAEPPFMLDIDGANVFDKKGNQSKLTLSAYNIITNFVPLYEAKLATLRQIEDAEDLKTVLKELNEMYNKNIIILSGIPKSVIFWTERINDYINTVLSVSDIINHILPNIKAAKSKFASQTNKYDKFKPVIEDVLSKIPDLSKKKTTPPKVVTPVVEEVIKPVVEEVTPVVEEVKPVVDEVKPVVEEVNPVVEEVNPVVEEKPIIIEAEELKDFDNVDVEEKPKSKFGCVGDNCAISGGANNDSYKKNQIHILKCFSALIKTNNEIYANLIEGNNFNYANIDSIDKFCIAILLLQVYNSLNSFVPQVKSFDDIISEISKLDENTSSLTDAINIRNYYSSIINNFVDIEYLDPDAIDYILNLYNVEVVEGENIVYNLHKWTNISYYLTTFIYTNLRAISGKPFTNSDDEKTFGEINNEYNNLDSFNVKEMAAICDIDSFKNDITNSDFIDEEAKANLNKQFQDLDKYKQMSLHLIKFCNDFVMKLSGGSLKIQLYSYDTIINVLNENGENKLVEEFNAIKINFPSALAQGIVLKKFEMPIRPTRPINMIRPTIPSRLIGVQAAGSYKAQRVRKVGKTRGRINGKRSNKKTKQRKQIKSRKYTRRAL